MIKHIALFKFDKFENIQEKENYYSRLKDAFDGLENRVPAIKSLQIGFDELHSEASYDFIVNVDIENMTTLTEYMNHPEHVKAGEVVREKMIDKKAIDYSF